MDRVNTYVDFDGDLNLVIPTPNSYRLARSSDRLNDKPEGTLYLATSHASTLNWKWSNATGLNWGEGVIYLVPIVNMRKQRLQDELKEIEEKARKVREELAKI